MSSIGRARPTHEPQGVTVLGSTGSVGVNTLDVIVRNPDRYRVVALSAHSNVRLLAQQCADFAVPYATISQSDLAADLKDSLLQTGARTEVLAGAEGLLEAVEVPGCDIVMAAIVGAAGLKPTLHAAELGKKVLLANKESLVVAGELFMRSARHGGACVLPVDSEHNAIFQAMPHEYHQSVASPVPPDGPSAARQTQDLESYGVRRIILTASGGPFLDLEPGAFAAVTPDQACAHPNWDMGRKISVDSATLMNKGLEVIEAKWLFSANAANLQVVIHPQSIIHSMVAYRDGSILAQLGVPDMRTPIAHTLAWPERVDAGVEALDILAMGELTFRPPDRGRFPCLRLAFEAMEAGGNASIVLNAANEVAVESFLAGRIGFKRIAEVVEQVMQTMPNDPAGELDDILLCDELSRQTANRVVKSYG